MEFSIMVLVVGSIIGFVASIFFVVRHLERKRCEAIESAAAELGLTFMPQGDANILSRFASFNLFNQGRSRKMTNLIEGATDEVQIAIFDYKYVTGSGKHQATHSQTIASLQSGVLSTPVFTMRMEGMFDKIGSAFGFQDIDFESHPDFSRMYLLKGDNEEQIRQFFSPDVLDFFETQQGISVEARPGALIIFRPGKRAKPDQFKELLSQAYSIFGVMVDQNKT